MHRRVAVIMAGGSGERFWPLSRADRPKQLLRLTSPTETLLEEAVNRISPLVGKENVFISTGGALQSPIEQAALVAPGNVLVEPDRRNTLGALVWVAASLLADGLDSGTSIAVLTADHKIGEPELFRSTVASALQLAKEKRGLVTIGVVPTRAETGYGYIEADRATHLELPHTEAYRAASFREKPNLPHAKHYVSSGNFLWNSGMFFWTLEAFLEQLSKADSAAHAITLRIADALKSKDSDGATAAFRELQNQSVDYALMEKADKVYVVRGSFPWDDVGAWDALERSLPADENGNVLEGEVVAIDTYGAIVYSDCPDVQVATLGVSDLIVVVTKDAVMVCPKAQAQRVRELLAAVKSRQPS